jgi:hypothetical protein
MATEPKKIVIHLSQAEISRQAMMEAGYDPVRFGKRQRSTVETDRKKASKRGYQKHKDRDASADYADSRTRDGSFLFGAYAALSGSVTGSASLPGWSLRSSIRRRAPSSSYRTSTGRRFFSSGEPLRW